jgi:hypothetical protein
MRGETESLNQSHAIVIIILWKKVYFNRKSTRMLLLPFRAAFIVQNGKKNLYRIHKKLLTDALLVALE